jgi:methionyl-tRNA formyltransferase
MEKPRIVFMGTPHFAIPSLQLLIDRNEDVVGVITQPDRPVGRGQHLTQPPIKTLALIHGLPLFQPPKVRCNEFLVQLQDLAPDLVIVVAFGHILTRPILDLPPLGCINVHASLLPAYRGAAPINWALIKGEKETGATIMLLDEGMDTGDILLQEAISILPAATAESLHDSLAHLGARLLGKALELLKIGALQPIPQDHSKATYAPPLKKEDGCINWNTSAQEILQRIRGMTPWPGCFTYIKGKLLKIYHAEIKEKEILTSPGKILRVTEHGVEVATGKGAISLKEIQMEGKKRMAVREFIKGYKIEEGTELTHTRKP